MPKKPKDEAFREMLGIRLSEEDAERIDRLVARVPLSNRHAVARAALRAGLALFEQNFQLLLDPDKARRAVKAAKPKTWKVVVRKK